MADKKISELTAIGTIVDADLFAIVDVSATETKKGTYLQLKTALATDFGVAIPATRIAFGNSGGDGITSDPDFTYDPATGNFKTGNGSYSFEAKGTGEIYRTGTLWSKATSVGQGLTTWGESAGVSCSTGAFSTMVGFQAGVSLVSGNGLTAFGAYALYVATDSSNTGIGGYAGRNHTTGHSCTYLGFSAGYPAGAGDNETGNYNTVIGTYALVGGNYDNVLSICGVGTGSNQIQLGGATNINNAAVCYYTSLNVGYSSDGAKHSTYYRTSTPEGAQAGDFGDIAYVNTGAAGAVYIKTSASPANTGWVALAAGGAGTVTSFSAGDLSPLFTTSEADPTTTPALSFSLNTQNANKVFAGPTNGADAAPTFRVLVAADIPSLSGTYLTVDGATTGATSQAQVFTSGIRTGLIDDNATSEIIFTISTVQKAAINATGIGLIDGSAANPSYYFSSDSSTGFYLKTGNSELGVSVNGVLVGGFNTTGLFAGLAGTLTGTLKFNGATSGTVTVQSAAAAGTWTLTLPTTDGNANEFLQTNGSGVTTWAAVSVYTDEQAQDAVGAMIDTTLVYVDATPLLTRAALTGDVTAPQGSNTTTIANDSVTYAKMQNVSATDRLLGRSTAGAGDVEEITCTSFGRSLIDDADAATARATLGAGYDLTCQTANGVTVGTGATVYGVPFFGGTFNATETNRQLTLKSAGVVQKLYVRTNSAQSGLGSLVITVRKNGANTGVTVTIAAGAAAGTFTDVANTESFAAGDLISFKVVNNAAATSANVMEVGVFVQ